MNSKKKSIKLIKNTNQKKLYKYNPNHNHNPNHNPNKKNQNKTKKNLKNKQKGGNIQKIQNVYSSDDYQEAGLVDFMKIKTNAVGTVPNLEMPPMPGCCIS
jgi:hypothetical protein